MEFVAGTSKPLAVARPGAFRGGDPAPPAEALPARVARGGRLAQAVEAGGLRPEEGAAPGAAAGPQLSTIYRTLDALGEAELVVESRLPDGPRIFEAHVGQHSHLLCERCGGIFHLPSGADNALREVLEKGAQGFEVSGPEHRFVE